MVAVKTGTVYGGGKEYDVLCFRCEAVVGRMTRAELSEYTARATETPLCFDCDGLFADITPSYLMPTTDELICLLDEDRKLRTVIFWPANPTHIVAKQVKYWQHTGLSCSPYLPKIAPKRVRNSGVTK